MSLWCADAAIYSQFAFSGALLVVVPALLLARPGWSTASARISAIMLVFGGLLSLLTALTLTFMLRKLGGRMPLDAFTFFPLLVQACTLFVCCFALAGRLRQRPLDVVAIASCTWLGALALAMLAMLVFFLVQELRIVALPDKMSQAQIDANYRLLCRTDACFSAQGLQYFAVCGTLIGAVRHKGMMQWDDDIDVGILEAQEIRLTSDAMRAALSIADLELDSISEGFYKVRPRGLGYPWIDIFVL